MDHWAGIGVAPGDSDVVAGGPPDQRPDPPRAMARLALQMGRADPTVPDLRTPLELRVSLASGPVIAGVIGRQKFIYDLWGDTVNTASRMESHGVHGRIQVTEATYLRLRGRYRFEDRGEIEVKGKARQRAYLLVGPHDGKREG